MCSCACRISILELAEVKLRAEFQQYADRITVLSNGIMWFTRHQVKAAYGRQRILARSTSRNNTDWPNVPAACQLHA